MDSDKLELQGGPAFPCVNGSVYQGMTLRDHFAATTMPGVLQLCGNDTCQENETYAEYFARVAYELADAMLAERAK